MHRHIWLYVTLSACLKVDKARVPFGLTLSKKQTTISMQVEYKVSFSDHDFLIGKSHKIIPSVYASYFQKEDRTIGILRALRCGSWSFRFCNGPFTLSLKANIYGKQWGFRVIIFSLVSKILNLDITFKMASQKYQKHVEIIDWKVQPF